MKKTALPFLISKKLHGQSIIEIVLAIGVASLVIGALVILGTVSLRTALSSARRTEATRLAVSGLEAMRFLRDSQGFSALKLKCYQIDVDSKITELDCAGVADGWQPIDLTTHSSSQAIFQRKIQVEEYGDTTQEKNTLRKVTVTVRWPEGSGATVGNATNQRDVVMSVVLSGWNQ